MLDGPRDSEGKPIELGAKVAFNLSGEVARGTVVRIGAPRRVSQWYVKHSIRIAGPKGHVSHVRNERSVLVI